MNSTATAAVFGAAALSAAALAAAWAHSRRSAGARGKRVAVVVTGCGFMDGAEVTEVVAALAVLSELGTKVTTFAPDKAQADVVDHQQGKPLGYAPRRIMQESARITRGDVRDLATLDVRDFDALVVPGGFGVAKSLSTWALDGPACSVDPHAERVIKEFHAARKPIACSCIAPVLLARLVAPVKITLGRAGPVDKYPYYGTIAQVLSIPGVEHVDASATEVVVDDVHKVVTTPAYMEAAAPHEVLAGVRAMCRAALRMA